MEPKDNAHKEVIQKQIACKMSVIEGLLSSYDHLLQHKVLKDCVGKTDVQAIKNKLQSDSKAMAPVASAIQVAFQMASEC